MNYPHQPYGQQHHPQQPPYGAWGAGIQTQVESGEERLAFIKKVYGLFTGSVAVSALGAMIALYAGAESSTLVVEGVKVPPLVAMVASSPWIMLFVMIGVVIGASTVRKVRGLNVVALFGMAFTFGIFSSVSIFIAQLNARTGTTLSASPVRDAFILAALMFGGLTGYVAVSKKDFSYLGSALSMGLWVIIGAALLNIFLGSSVLGLAIASVGLILFGGYVLYDTSRILKGQERDAIGAAMQLYLDFFNIFLYLLRIFGSRR